MYEDKSHLRWTTWRPKRYAALVLPLRYLAEESRLRYACPACGARRYEHCVEWRPLIETVDEWYPVEKPELCTRRAASTLEDVPPFAPRAHRKSGRVKAERKPRIPPRLLGKAADRARQRLAREHWIRFLQLKEIHGRNAGKGKTALVAEYRERYWELYQEEKAKLL